MDGKKLKRERKAAQHARTHAQRPGDDATVSVCLCGGERKTMEKADRLVARVK